MALIGLGLIVPESPIWLIRNSRSEAAMESLIWLRGDANVARLEFDELSVRYEDEMANRRHKTAASSSSLWQDFREPYAFKPILIIFPFLVLFNLSGTYLIVSYALDIISQVNLVVTAQNANVILSTVRLIVTIGFCWLFMHVRRRRIYLIAGIGSTISTFALGYVVSRSSDDPNHTTTNTWIAGLLLLIYVATNTGLMIAPGFLTGELLPARIRGRFAGYIYTFFSVISFVLNKMFPLLNYHIGMVGVLTVFGVASVLTTTLVYFMVPETKGKSLIEIEQYFQQDGLIYIRSKKVCPNRTLNECD